MTALFDAKASRTLEDQLDRLVREAHAAAWAEENREAIASHARFVEKHGLLSDRHRFF